MVDISDTCLRCGRAYNGDMETPDRVPVLKWATILVAAYGAIWIALEGNLVRVTVLGCAVALLLVGALFRRWVAGRRFAIGLWVVVCAALGTLAGFSSAILTLIFMALKTGLHAHGPEFDALQIGWVVQQIPWWTSAGLLAGLGLGLIYAVVTQS